MIKECFIYISVLLAVMIMLSVPARAGDEKALVPQTGQTDCYDANGQKLTCTGTGQDADKLAGVKLPKPRFVVRGDGTVKDLLTNLIWLQNANCFPDPDGHGSGVNWQTALESVNGLVNGQCGLTDGSKAGDWRLPNVKELQSLIDYGLSGLALDNSNAIDKKTGKPTSAFRNLQSKSYWSSSSFLENPKQAWYIGLRGGRTEHLIITSDGSVDDGYNVRPALKSEELFVWAVRDDLGK